MSKVGVRRPEASGLEILGIGEMQEHVYLALLSSRSATAEQIAKQLHISSRAAREALAAIEATGLATHMSTAPKAYVAATPEFAIEALIKQRQRAIEQARTAIPLLNEAFARATNAQGDRPVLELITDRERLSLVLARMYKSFRTEAMCFQRAPVLVPTERTRGALPIGTNVRSVSDTSFLDAPGALGILREDIERGEQARTFSKLPFKMLIVDRTTAMIILDNRSPETEPTLLIHRSALVDALCLLFEFVWEKATPVVAGTLLPKEDGAAEAAQKLIPLLAAGLNDKAIAYELRCSASTLNRRIGDLMEALGVRTRFQLGMQIALNMGSTPASPKSD